MLLTDARVALLLLNDARYRTMERFFGLPRDQVNAATAVAGLVLADAVSARVRRLLLGPNPSAADVALGASALRESVYAFSGQSPSETPLLGTLIVIGVLGHVARPVVGRTLHEVRVSSRRLRVAFNGAFNSRYGHAVVRGQRKLKRASSVGRDRLSPRGER
ncbi:MAG TPA: hypothetical protein VMP89_07175 [Solirubrobacteraceae bacterium]|nr:hypothetical protein [Solirubrobacteraceae bacterium]